MKIAHVVRRFSRGEWGGTESVVANLVEGQRARGDEVRVFTTSALQPASGTREAETFPYFYPYFPLSTSNRIALDKKGGNPYAPALFRAVKAFRPDVIHVHACGRLACASIRLAERLGVPSVVTLHGGALAVPEGEMKNMLAPIRHTFPYGGILDRLFGLHFDPLSRVSAIVTCSREEASLLKTKYLASRVFHLPNGVRPETFAHEPIAKVKKVLCLSRVDYQKNQIALVELLAARPDLEVRLVGPVTSAWYRDKIRARAEELGVSSRLRIDPALAPNSPLFHEAFAEADAFVLPSLHEPFGIVALEAMQHGVPLVASTRGGLVDFVRDGENGLLFDPAAPSALAAAFDRLTPETAAKCAAGGYETVKDYSWSAIVERLAKIYGEAKKVNR